MFLFTSNWLFKILMLLERANLISVDSKRSNRRPLLSKPMGVGLFVKAEWLAKCKWVAKSEVDSKLILSDLSKQVWLFQSSVFWKNVQVELRHNRHKSIYRPLIYLVCQFCQFYWKLADDRAFGQNMLSGFLKSLKSEKIYIILWF